MSAPILFNHPKARHQLMREGLVYTLRRPRSVGIAIAYQGNRFRGMPLRKLGRVMISTQWAYAHDDQLEICLHASGFESVADWRKAAGPTQTHLYRVRLLHPWEEAVKR
jgi:hypothetical protein